MQLAIPGSLPYGLHAINQSNEVEIWGVDTLKNQRVPPNAAARTVRASRDNAEPGQKIGRQEMSPFSLPSIACPPAASRGCIGGLWRHWTHGGPTAGSRRLPAELQPIVAGTRAPAPAPARGRRRGSHPGPEPCWVLVRAARPPAAGSAPARTAGSS